MNKTKCADCVHYMQQYKYKAAVRMPTKYGWCAKQSVFPSELQEWDNANIPIDAPRVDKENGRAQPYMVYGDKVKLNCLKVMPKNE